LKRNFCKLQTVEKSHMWYVTWSPYYPIFRK